MFSEGLMKLYSFSLEEGKSSRFLIMVYGDDTHADADGRGRPHRVQCTFGALCPPMNDAACDCFNQILVHLRFSEFPEVEKMRLWCKLSGIIVSAVQTDPVVFSDHQSIMEFPINGGWGAILRAYRRRAVRIREDQASVTAFVTRGSVANRIDPAVQVDLQNALPWDNQVWDLRDGTFFWSVRIPSQTEWKYFVGKTVQ